MGWLFLPPPLIFPLLTPACTIVVFPALLQEGKKRGGSWREVEALQEAHQHQGKGKLLS